MASHAARLIHQTRRNLRTLSKKQEAAQITVLPNKLRVATEPTPGHFSSVGVYVDAGSRYEDDSQSGICHLLEKLAFKSSANLSIEQMSEITDTLGGQIFCAATRETMMYQASHFGSAIPSALSVIAESILRPRFLEEELDAVRDAALYEFREMQNKPEMVLPEILHQVAYGRRGLGNPLFCPEERVNFIDGSSLKQFMDSWYLPNRIVIAGAGMSHEELVRLVQSSFGFEPLNEQRTQEEFYPAQLTSPASASFQNQRITGLRTHVNVNAKTLARTASLLSSPPTKSHTSSYTGGFQFLFRSDPTFNHIYLAFESVPLDDPDIYTVATLQFLLGGGGSFSAGGPGKGMYSRLYTHILNHHPEIDHCAAFHHIYTDSSLFGLFASFLPRGSSSVVRGVSPDRVLPQIIHQFSLLLHSSVATLDLMRAKNQLKSSLVMGLESRAVEVEDLGRQILLYGRKIPVSEMCERIDEVTINDIRRVSHRIFGDGCKQPPSIVVQAEEDLHDIVQSFRKYGVGGDAINKLLTCS